MTTRRRNGITHITSYKKTPFEREVIKQIQTIRNIILFLGAALLLFYLLPPENRTDGVVGVIILAVLAIITGKYFGK